MARITFTRNYDHRWPSRAITAFKAGWTGTVKAEVAELAQSKGVATPAPKAARPQSDERLSDSRRGRKLDRSHDAHDVGAGVRNQLLDGTGE